MAASAGILHPDREDPFVCVVSTGVASLRQRKAFPVGAQVSSWKEMSAASPLTTEFPCANNLQVRQGVLRMKTHRPLASISCLDDVRGQGGELPSGTMLEE